MNAPPIVVQRLVTSTGAVDWLLYRSGQAARGALRLTDAEMAQLLRDVMWQIHGNQGGTK